jgi:hypothetical protein
MCLVRISNSGKDLLFHSNDDNFAESASHTFVSPRLLVERLAQADRKVSFRCHLQTRNLSEELAMAKDVGRWMVGGTGSRRPCRPPPAVSAVQG